MTALHSALTGADIHTPISFQYVDTAARTAAVVTAGDLYKFARQTDDNSVWMLVATTPTWIRVDANGIAAAANSVDVKAIKSTPGAIQKGQACYIVGYDVGNAAVRIDLAQANNSATMSAIGIAAESFTDVVPGNLRVVGQITNIDTSAWTAGVLLHISDTVAGALTTTHISGPSLHQQVGRVIAVDVATGIIEVNVPIGFDHLSNGTPQNLATAPASGTSAFAARSDHKHRQGAYAVGELTTDISTSSGTLADVPGMLVTVDVQANSKLMIWASLSGMANATARMVVLVDGVQVGTGRNDHGHNTTTSGFCINIAELSGVLAAGPHTVKAQWAAVNNTPTVAAASQPGREGGAIAVQEVFA